MAVMVSFASRQMGAVMNALLATQHALVLKPPIKLLWLADAEAKRQGWIEHVLPLTAELGWAVEVHDVGTRFDLNAATEVADAVAHAAKDDRDPRVVLNALGGRDHDKSLLQAAFDNLCIPNSRSYLQTRPIEFRWMDQADGSGWVEHTRRTADWPTLTVDQLVRAAGFVTQSRSDAANIEPTGAAFEALVQDRVAAWVASLGQAHRALVRSHGAGPVIHDAANQPLTDWDVVVALSDGGLFVIECKQGTAFAKLSTRAKQSEMSRGKSLLHEFGSAASEWLLAYGFGSAQVEQPDFRTSWDSLIRAADRAAVALCPVALDDQATDFLRQQPPVPALEKVLNRLIDRRF